ncbi:MULTISPECIES: ABC transporter permease [Bacillus]|uniref:ABC transporter permease n=2 Tax=Bacillus TaxID=1386 RepID=A0A0M3RAZ4_9BACI|nr:MULTISPECIES: ABC transporter permease subunit [Bacillus]ALC84066.1 ABC transporter permease [Bacillus gobiensis]MED1094806.1 ABC transporter permease subunit [Bacillus capparidis]
MNKFALFTLLPFFLLIAMFLVVPVVTMISASLSGENGSGWTLGNYIEIFINPFYYQSFKNSAIISFTSSLIGVIIATFVAYSFTKFHSAFQEKLLLFVNMTSNFAGVPLAFAFIILLGNSGVFTLLFQQFGIDLFQHFDLYSWAGLTMIYVYFQLPLAVLLLFPIYKGIDEKWKEASFLLGASTFTFWRKIGFPYILPAITGTLSILFANAMGAYGTAYALVGSKINLLPIRIGALVSGDIYARPELGSALAVTLALLMMTAMLVNEWLLRKVRRDMK